jgi:hypothetical protein
VRVELEHGAFAVVDGDVAELTAVQHQRGEECNDIPKM